VTLSTLLDEVQAANRSYAGLPRDEDGAEVIRAGRLEMSFWRRDVVGRLLDLGEKRGPSGDGREGRARLAQAVEGVNLRMGPRALARLRVLLQDDDVYGRVAAHQGVRHPGSPRHHALAGPARELNIRPNLDSRWPLERWRKLPAFGEHAFQDDAVRYRGVALRSGDVILSNVNRDGNMVFSALWDPVGVFTHCAVVVFLQEGDRRLPAVIETYERGVRAVPLSVFLSPRYVCAAEIFRHRAIGPGHEAALAESAEAMVRDTRGYNFASWDDDRSYLSCTSVGRFLFADLGIHDIEPRSELRHPQVKKNLQRLGYGHFERFFAPMDYLLNPSFSLVGVVDNNQFERMVARELVARRFRTAFEHVSLDPNRLPRMRHVNAFAVAHIRRRSLLGRALGAFSGFDHVSLPKGPDPVLAAVQPFEHQLARAVGRMIPEVEAYMRRQGSFTLQALFEDGGMNDVLSRHLRPAWMDR
jgi:hypothetical protein